MCLIGGQRQEEFLEGDLLAVNRYRHAEVEPVAECSGERTGPAGRPMAFMPASLAAKRAA